MISLGYGIYKYIIGKNSPCNKENSNAIHEFGYDTSGYSFIYLDMIHRIQGLAMIQLYPVYHIQIHELHIYIYIVNWV